MHCRKAVPGDEHAVSALAKRLEIHEGDDPSLAMHRGFLFYAKPEDFPPALREGRPVNLLANFERDRWGRGR